MLFYSLGWGRMVGGGKGANILQQAMLPVADDRRCQNTNGRLGHVYRTPWFVLEAKGEVDVRYRVHSCRARGSGLKGLCRDCAHVWAVTVADCLWTNRKRVSCTRGNLHNLRFIVREVGVFRTFMFVFNPHNSYLFSGIPQVNVADDKNRINNPVRFETNIYLRVFLWGLLHTHANKAVTDWQTKINL